jgi:AraC-like DNA-binding protein
MQYVEYVRIMKAIELIYKKKKKVYDKVGYNSSSVFSKSFLRVTGIIK